MKKIIITSLLFISLSNAERNKFAATAAYTINQMSKGIHAQKTTEGAVYLPFKNPQQELSVQISLKPNSFSNASVASSKNQPLFQTKSTVASSHQTVQINFARNYQPAGPKISTQSISVLNANRFNRLMQNPEFRSFFNQQAYTITTQINHAVKICKKLEHAVETKNHEKIIEALQELKECSISQADLNNALGTLHETIFYKLTCDTSPGTLATYHHRFPEKILKNIQNAISKFDSGTQRYLIKDAANDLMDQIEAIKNYQQLSNQQVAEQCYQQPPLSKEMQQFYHNEFCTLHQNVKNLVQQGKLEEALIALQNYFQKNPTHTDAVTRYITPIYDRAQNQKKFYSNGLSRDGDHHPLLMHCNIGSEIHLPENVALRTMLNKISLAPNIPIELKLKCAQYINKSISENPSAAAYQAIVTTMYEGMVSPSADQTLLKLDANYACLTEDAFQYKTQQKYVQSIAETIRQMKLLNPKDPEYQARIEKLYLINETYKKVMGPNAIKSVAIQELYKQCTFADPAYIFSHIPSLYNDVLDRAKALADIAKNGPVITTKEYPLDFLTRRYIHEKGMDLNNFAQRTGNQYEQAIHKENVDQIARTADTHFAQKNPILHKMTNSIKTLVEQSNNLLSVGEDKKATFSTDAAWGILAKLEGLKEKLFKTMHDAIDTLNGPQEKTPANIVESLQKEIQAINHGLAKGALKGIEGTVDLALHPVHELKNRLKDTARVVVNGVAKLWEVMETLKTGSPQEIKQLGQSIADTIATPVNNFYQLSSHERAQIVADVVVGGLTDGALLNATIGGASKLGKGILTSVETATQGIKNVAKGAKTEQAIVTTAEGITTEVKPATFSLSENQAQGSLINQWTRTSRMIEFEQWKTHGITIDDKIHFYPSEHFINSLKKSGRKDIMPNHVINALKQAPKIAGNPFTWKYIDPNSGVTVFVNEINQLVGVHPGNFE